MIFSLDVRRARKGDCLLLHFGTKQNPGLVVIDGGPKSVYTPHLKPRLDEIRQARGLGASDALRVDVLMVSHVDDDHIQGILDLTAELIVKSDAHQPLPVRVLSLWHNSFDAVIGSVPKELTAALSGHFGPAALSGGLPADATLGDDVKFPGGRPEEGTVRDSLKVLASIEQGHRLRTDADRLGVPRNPDFNGALVMAKPGGGKIEVGSGLTFIVVGPMKPELQALHKKHQDWLKELKKKGKTPPAALAAFVDPSVPNLSSIVVLAEAGAKRMLLTGDARGDKILAGLQHVGLLKAGSASKMHVDLLKVPHHGSANNLTRGFFERITADHYVFSGNGEHGNPERASLEMLLDARGQAPLAMHFTYPLAAIDVERKKDWQKEQAKEKKRKAKKVRPNWSAKKHALVDFFAAHPLGSGQQINVITHDTKPHVIELLDKL